MERFRRFFGCEVQRERLDDAGRLAEARLTPRYLPDAFEDFDEMEFLAPFEGDKRLVISLALEQKKIMRVLFGWTGPDDPDDQMRSLDEEELKRALDLQGERLSVFLEGILRQA